MTIDPFIGQAKLTAPTTGLFKREKGDARFGVSVAVSSDGNTALIGGFEDHRGVGAAWVFIRTGTAWTLQRKLVAPTVGPHRKAIGHAVFGSSVALSADGNTALIGAAYDDPAVCPSPCVIVPTGVGAAWVFIREGGVWTEQRKLLVPTTGAGTMEIGDGLFGSSVALSSDGNTALLGGPFFNSYAGAARVFTRAGTVWTEQQTLSLPSIGPGAEIGAANFGWSVALSHDAKTALIGGDADNGGVGAAWVFTPGSILIPL